MTKPAPAGPTPGAEPVPAEEAEAEPAFAVGDRVRHEVFGSGIVVEAKASGDDMQVTVAFRDGHGIKRLLLGVAPLEKVNT